MAIAYELVLEGRTEKVVEGDEILEVGDALLIEHEVWLILRESEFAATQGRARFECRRALYLRDQAQELTALLKATQVVNRNSQRSR
jgi:hypothetical protein